MKVWTKEKVDWLRVKAAEGLTGSEIGNLCGVSRNAIIGACHRNGINLSSLRGNRRPKQGVPKPRAQSTRFLKTQVTKLTEAELPIEEHREKPKDWVNEGGCQWPFGDPEDKDNFFFCGYDIVSVGYGSYCPQHAAKAYRRA